ncbi:hypothetical protein OOK41_21710 [Micromonospora sp. NBC_01655]|uniref:hypothetical protein n=1 Tax=unclassified Micromonospora TaxID=2617518 RepID=UPI000FFEAC36|nr:MULTISPECIES: hypothetical protein [unclassified Micromonospora]MCX4472895.1 hypothetical protein [Micromonospora sp. NBC_01655]
MSHIPVALGSSVEQKISRCLAIDQLKVRISYLPFAGGAADAVAPGLPLPAEGLTSGVEQG